MKNIKQDIIKECKPKSSILKDTSQWGSSRSLTSGMFSFNGQSPNGNRKRRQSIYSQSSISSSFSTVKWSPNRKVMKHKGLDKIDEGENSIVITQVSKDSVEEKK